MGMTTKVSRLRVQYFSIFLFSVSDTLAFADQSRDEDKIEIEAGTRCAKHFKDGYRCVLPRTAPHHTAAPYVAGTGDGEEDEMGSIRRKGHVGRMSVKRAGDGKNVGRAGMRIGWDWRQSLTWRRRRRCVR